MNGTYTPEVEDQDKDRESSTEGGSGIEGESKGEAEVRKLLQKADGSLYIHPSRVGRTSLNCEIVTSNHTAMRCTFDS
jgi:hypothetical protein